MTINTNNTKTAMTFGDFIAGAYRAWGARRAKGLVWLAVNARLVVFQGPQRLVISEEQHENLSFKSNAH
jgi:G3E family GTPase